MPDKIYSYIYLINFKKIISQFEQNFLYYLETSLEKNIILNYNYKIFKYIIIKRNGVIY